MLLPVDLGNPVNRGASLNQGLLYWWKGMPNNKGTRTIFDLCGANHLTQVAGSGSIDPTAMWSPRSKECEFSFSGGVSPAYYASNDPAPEINYSTSGMSIGAWIWPNNVDTYNVMLGGSSGGISSTFVFYVGHYHTGLLINGAAGAVYQGTGPNLVQYKPHYATWVMDAAGYRAYVDGFEVLTYSTGSARHGLCKLYLGNDYWGYGINGGVGSVRVWKRGLAAGECYALYREELAGNPTTLNRYRPRTSVFLGGTLPSNRRRRLLCAGGR